MLINIQSAGSSLSLGYHIRATPPCPVSATSYLYAWPWDSRRLQLLMAPTVTRTISGILLSPDILLLCPNSFSYPLNG
jgi:hypothetical protein